MIETLQANLELFLLIFALINIGPFIFVLTSVSKGAVKMRTDHFAITLGAGFGVLIMVAIMTLMENVNVALAITLPLMGIIQGALQGASAVGIKTASDKTTEVGKEELLKTGNIEIPEEIKEILK